MKIVSYRAGGSYRAGLVAGDWVVDAERSGKAYELRLPISVRELLAMGGDGMASAKHVIAQLPMVERSIAAGERRPRWLMRFDDVELGPPVPDPEKIIALGFNYKSHVEEQKAFFKKPIEAPRAPVIFAKYASALAGPRDPIVLPPPGVTTQVDYECEVVAVIGKQARGVSEADALKYVAGYMVMNDVSARDCQFSDRQFTRAKSFDTFAPCGPWIVTADELGGKWPLKLWADVNGERMQESNTGDMFFSLPCIISYLSRGMTLRPGDLIATGTPAGVGAFRTPQRFLKAGDIVECGVEGIGGLVNQVVSG